MTSTVAAASRKHVELSLELKRKLIQEHEHGVPFTLLGKKYHIATSTAANIWRKKDFFLRSRMSGSRKRCNDRSKYKIVNQVTALFVKSMLERNHKIDGEVIKRFARTAAAQCNFKDFHGSNGWLDSFKKRENVCWVRRRGERSAAAAALHLATNGHSQGANAECRRSDSPNLSAAAAAAAVAATAQQQQHNHHRHSPNTLQQQHCQQTGAWPDNSAPTTSDDPGADQAAGSCARCSVAAAAAAVAALNSSDSLHERDHEIEDWFHGIPFLCQFFEDYQSMHQQQQQQNQQPTDSISQTQQQPANGQQQQHQQQQQQQQLGSIVPMEGGQPGFVVGGGSLQTAGSVCSSSSSSTCSSTYLQHPATHSQRSLVALGLVTNSSSSSSSLGGQNSAGLCLGSTSSSPSAASSTTSGSAHNNGSSNNGYIPGRSLSDAHELIETSFRTSASLADIHSLCGPTQQQRTISTEVLARTPQQQQQIKCEQYSTMGYGTDNGSASDNNNSAFQQTVPVADFSVNSEQQAAANSSSGQTNNNSNSNNPDQQLMEINFTHHQQQVSQEQALEHDAAMDVVAADCCQLDGCQQQQQGKSLGRASEAKQSAALMAANNDYNSDDQDFYLNTTRFVPLDARSDDLLYHDEVSNHNDCCSDHYDQSANGATCNELQQLHERYQTDCLAGGAQSSASGGATCYMDEYEYENISTIRHYPVPMPPPPAPQQVSSAAQEEPANFGEHQDLQCQQQQQQQLGACSITARQQQQGFASQVNNGQQLTPADYLQHGTETGELKVLQQQQDHEQMIEHADHEEHNLLHNALMRSPEKLKLIDSIITLLNYASNYNQKMLVPLLEIKRCIERDLEVVLSDTTAASGQQQSNCCQQQQQATGLNSALLQQTAGNNHESRDILGLER